jgi:C-5 cytosine-specific DNA methylase
VKPRLLDLFCGAGGAAVGYSRAGFEIVGVDIEPQPNYPFEFWQGDALLTLSEYPWEGRWDAIHASPPCQGYANVTLWRGDQEEHPRLIEPTRELLKQTGLPYVLENVRTEALENPIMLCGSQLGLPIRRHRYFETNWDGFALMPSCQHHPSHLAFEHKGERAYADAMGCGWMTSLEAREAIPPMFTAFLGARLMAHLKAQEKAAR